MERVTGYRDGNGASTIDERLLEFVASKVADYPSFLARVNGAIDLGDAVALLRGPWLCSVRRGKKERKGANRLNPSNDPQGSRSRGRLRAAFCLGPRSRRPTSGKPPRRFALAMRQKSTTPFVPLIYIKAPRRRLR